MRLLPESIHRCRRYPTKFNSGRDISAFSSKANLEAIKGKGVEDVAFTKAHFAVTDMVKSSWVYQRLRRFRCGIEGVISFLKRVFGLDRCTWRSLPSFKSYVWSSIITCNLLMMARHLLR